MAQTQGGGGGTLDLRWWGRWKDFLGQKNLAKEGFFWYSKIRGRVVQRIKCNQTWAQTFGVGFFGGWYLIQGLFFGFVGTPREFLDFDFCIDSIIPASCILK